MIIIMSSRSKFVVTLYYRVERERFPATCRTSTRGPRRKANFRFVSKMNGDGGSVVQAFHASISISAGASSFALTDWTT
jgi:hypothetical protein